MSLTVSDLSLMRLRHIYPYVTNSLRFELDETETNPPVTHSLTVTLKLDETETYPYNYVTLSHSLKFKLDETETNPHVTHTHSYI